MNGMDMGVAISVALDITSLTWMVLIAVLIFAQKLLPVRVRIDVPVALMIVGLGILIVIAPSTVPGFRPSM